MTTIALALALSLSAAMNLSSSTSLSSAPAPRTLSGKLAVSHSQFQLSIPSYNYKQQKTIICSAAVNAIEQGQGVSSGLTRIGDPSQVSGVLGCQWGDEGKGKLVDILAHHFHIVARCQVSLLFSIKSLLSFMPIISTFMIINK